MHEVLEEILTKIEKRALELRAFCPSCGQMSRMTKHEERNMDTSYSYYYTCSNCPYEFDRFEHLEEYNIMRFSV